MRKHCPPFAALVALLLGAAELASAGTPPVRAGLRTPWAAPNILLEVGEYIAAENASAYFPYIGAVTKSLPEARTPAALHQHAFSIIKDNGFLAGDLALPLLNMSLALHTGAPAVEADYQYYRVEVAPHAEARDACDVWADWQGQRACSPDELVKLANLHKGATPRLHEHDRTLGPKGEEKGTVVLYGDIASPQLPAFHQFLIKLSESAGVRYVLRWKPSDADDATQASTEKLWLAGYGVELALKSTEYMVLDDRNKKDGDADKNAESGDEAADAAEDDDSDGNEKLVDDDVDAELGMNAAQMIVAARNPLAALRKLSGNFPKYAPHLAGRKPSKELQDEIGRLQALSTKPGVTGLWVNGVPLNLQFTGVFQLLRLLRSEYAGVTALQQLGLSANQAVELLYHAHRLNEKSRKMAWFGEAYDVRDHVEGGRAVVFMNDIEKDARYRSWPRDLFEILRPTRPGQLIRLAKNAVTVQIMLDLSSVQSLIAISKDVLDIIQANVPMRFAVVPIVGDDEDANGTKMAKLFYYFSQQYGRKGFIQFFDKERADKKKKKAKKAEEGENTDADDAAATPVKLSLEEVLQADSEATALTAAARAMCRRLRLRAGKDEAMYVNGKYYKFSPVDYRRHLADIYNSIIQYLQQRLFDGGVEEKTDIYEHFLTLPEVRTRMNPHVYEETPRSINWLDTKTISPAALRDILYINGGESSCLDADQHHHARTLTLPILPQATTSQLRIAALHNPGQKTVQPLVPASFFYQLARKPLSKEHLQAAIAELDRVIAGKVLLDEGDDESAAAVAAHNAAAATIVAAVGAQSADRYIVINSRIVGPVPTEDRFESDDFELLIGYERENRITRPHQYLSALSVRPEYSDTLLYASSILGRLAQSSFVGDAFDKPGVIQRENTMDRIGARHALFTVGTPFKSTIRVQAILDPLSEMTQKWASILEVLGGISGVSVQVYLNPNTLMQELPLKRFYQFLMPSRLEYDEQTGATLATRATFTDLPEDMLLTMGLDTISAWLAMPTVSEHDLDNLKLDSSSRFSSVDAVFELEHLLVEGHVRDLTPDNPRGLQLNFGTTANPAQEDTSVMANVGYFQLKANPGVFHLTIREGRSSEFYRLQGIDRVMWNNEDEAEGSAASDEQEETKVDTRITINSFEGVVLFPTVRKRPGYETRELLGEDGEQDHTLLGSIKDKMTGWMGGKKADGVAPGKAEINIFSVASGHLYERFLSVMITSVMRHTKSTVKFWFIENFLSPSFKDFLPHLAKELNFDFELITYQWPHWLRKQSEKQRKIWGYKILFLDVLFPLDLEKVVFVDADQIVRADLKELVDLDLQGAPYGYTPFCADREEMDGFRFWREGYWKTHLRGKPYHISALYVVDLVRFRAMAAGDMLRGQYQALSADPNSLANLDQDLPNNMQDDVPIFSLPQEWLWCETWCSDASLKQAKTIDLCNNPLTKEPKLDRARRQIPEWSEYDAEVAALAARVAAAKEQQSTEQPTEAETPTSSNSDEEYEADADVDAEEDAEHDEL
ncbi:UDP-glucose:Glyco protein glucosyltransferase-domain-containing protein [Thamnocephalis sphaerospora]|uniref:UDP-glucose:Glyco protein glucosyltransferase-domain-containing protein n=1 Tax=Thamnocephalis sphaerospora TaxID=78915 RepID=A0A4P9XVN2_9FUNG|nr:UDP-glucose:Glyco protein glucosyltransferase-domain-containing protein [Thamnocephalis sphaerospora]|eukprot:RKP10347.1 UDP-glucose:Glyco protein glucosyltransferase-domain-containing protein [Thamnocephalis sphaerospora]